MNKATKGALAVGAAAMLLLGGAGSIAYWQSSASAGAADFTMGTLGVESHDDAVWKRGDTVIDPATSRLIPGDEVVYTESFELSVSGDGLIVTAELVDYSRDSPDGWYTSPSLQMALEGDSDVIEHLYSHVYEVKKSGTVTLTATLSINSGEGEGRNDSFAVDLGSLLLTQVAELPEIPYG